MSSGDEIDVELLIMAVKKRLCLWNYKLQDYSNKTIKNRAWVAVCEEIVNDFKDKSIIEKNAIGIQVQSKWKTLRDGFTRYCRTLKRKSGSAVSKAKQYTFYDQLLFLKDVTEDKGQSTSNFDAPSQTILPPTTTPTPMPKRQRIRQSDGDDALIEKLTKKLNYKLDKAERDFSPPPDEDKLFLLSLVSDFKNITADWKLDAKLEVMQVIKHYKSLSMPSTSHSSYNYAGYSTTTHSARPESQVTTNESLSSQNSMQNTIPSTSHSSHNYSAYSTTTHPERPKSQLTNIESLSSEDSVSNTIITELFSE
ncbi:uncharacterized protein LOC126780071 [Nymphalis io]|uniref:uncharacterized protein LOC126769612 n=1 Tax=Inachis io TaxID=171585 RepID=UPI00212E3A2A|nr:uncharacterized protein LOC126769612 [Nymphalis io]XP_050348694.1 uncharacterized protein LOC126772382 [Nymphalis io]XP_050357175.1 uncharacterized protein LOC126777911 [Nymphalis io]XP_050360289.1 uncharacterized protein LOC126780071 [Nymphalis io]